MPAPHRRTLLVVLLVVLSSIAVGASCKKRPKLVIDAPATGSFSTASSILVEGRVVNVAVSQIMTVTVNGAPATLVNNQWSLLVPLDPVAVVNPILVEASLGTGDQLRERITVMAGDAIPDGDFSPMGIGMRINDSGLNSIEPAITSLVDLDLATLLPPGTLVINDFCYQDSFLGCVGRVDVTVSGSPPPSIGSFSIDADAQTNSVDGDVLLNDLAIRANVVAVSGIGFSCTVDIDAATTNILGNYGLAPDGVDPSNIDVTQNGSVNVVFGNFQDDTNCGGFLGGIVEALISLFIGDIQDLVEPELENYLNTQDAFGNTPVAGAIETALAGIELSGPIGEAIGVSLETPLFDVFEDVNGITLDSDARITAAMPDPDAPDLLESFHLPAAFPSYGTTAPVSGLPYGLALSISSSAFNQLLKAEIESGLLRTVLEDIDFVGLLVDIELEPTMAPVITDDPGPFGEIALLKVPHLLVTMKQANTNNVLLRFAADAELGLDVDLVNGELAFLLGALDGSNVNIDILANPLGGNEASLETVILLILPLVFPDLASSLGTFPLPEFFGLQLGLVEVSRTGDYLSLYTNLNAAP